MHCERVQLDWPGVGKWLGFCGGPSTSACVMGADVAFETEGMVLCTIQKIWNCTRGVLENFAEGELRLEMFVCS